MVNGEIGLKSYESEVITMMMNLGRYIKMEILQVIAQNSLGSDTNVIENLQYLKVICKLMEVIYDC